MDIWKPAVGDPSDEKLLAFVRTNFWRTKVLPEVAAGSVACGGMVRHEVSPLSHIADIIPSAVVWWGWGGCGSEGHWGHSGKCFRTGVILGSILEVSLYGESGGLS